MGLNLQFGVQPSPDGLAQAFVIGANFVGDGPSALVLGDNVFDGHEMTEDLGTASKQKTRATVFAYRDKIRSDMAWSNSMRPEEPSA